jgi:hypothetical protein
VRSLLLLLLIILARNVCLERGKAILKNGIVLLQCRMAPIGHPSAKATSTPAPPVFLLYQIKISSQRLETP